MTNADLAAKYERLGYIDINELDDADEFQAILAALRAAEATPPEVS